jgi:hypothetical protein
MVAPDRVEHSTRKGIGCLELSKPRNSLSDFYNYLAILREHWLAFMSAGPFLVDRLITWFWPWGRYKLDTFPHRRQIFLWFIVFGVFWAGFSAWRDEHQVRLANTKPPLDPSSLYQNGFPVASFELIKTYPDSGKISFAFVTASRELDMNAAFEFRDWKMLCSGEEGGPLRYGAVKFINYTHVECKVLGTR